MKQVNLKWMAFLLCVTCSSGIMMSCSDSKDITGGGGTESATDNQLVLTINTANPGSRATNLTPTAGETPGDDKHENQINRLTVGVFSSDGTVRTIQEYTKDGTNKFSTSADGTTTTATVTTTSLAKDDRVLVAVNAPTNRFAGVQNSDAFTKSMTSDEALTTPAPGETADLTKEATDNIPMYGESKIVVGDGGTYSSIVPVQHQVAKITVASVGVDFDPNGPYKDATFQPTAFFLTNVPDNLNFTKAAATGSSTVWEQGGESSITATYKAYLGTGDLGTAYTALKGIAGSTTASVNINKFFYTMPNSVVANNTKLVIEGKFDPDGKGTTSTVFYPVNINWQFNGTVPDKGTAKTVSPNTNYNCTVTIKTKGTDDPSKSIDPSVASINVTVTPFTTVNQSTVFE